MTKGTKLIYPQFWTDEKLLSVSRDARLLFIGLWFLADKDGVVQGDADEAKKSIFPNETVKDIRQWMGELLKVKVVQDRAGRMVIPNYARYQKGASPSAGLIEDVYEHWNDVSPRKQRVLTPGLRRSLWSVIKAYGADKVKDAMDVYSKVLKDPSCWFSYEYDLHSFLDRGVEKFEGRTVDDFKRTRKAGVTSLDLG